MAFTEVRDLLYLDFEKAASIWSQFEGGLRERVAITDDDGKGQKAGVKFGIPKIAEATLGAEYAQKRSTLETKILHHDILNRVDDELSGLNLVIDLSASIEADESSPEAVRAAVRGYPYVKATGACVIEDYPRILAISERFFDVINFVARCGMESLKQAPEYVAFQQQIEAAKDKVRKTHDHNKKAIATKQLQALESSLGGMAAKQLSGVEQWLLDGIKVWIDTFMPNRINFRTYPFPKCPSFQVFCNLKRDCFVDQDPQHLLYGYGNRPNVPLTVFGLITSIPEAIDSRFDPMAEFGESQSGSEQIAFERGFRQLFGAMDGIEAFMRYSRYPNITVHPISVYRSFAVGESRK